MNDAAGIGQAVVMKSGDHGTTRVTSDDVAAASFGRIAFRGGLTVGTGLSQLVATLSDGCTHSVWIQIK